MTVLREMLLKTIILVAAAVAFYSNAVAANIQDRWWQNDAEGWFFYKEKPKVEEKQPEQEDNSLSPSKENEKNFVEVMKERGERLLSEAIQRPTVENVRAYMEHNNLMMKLAENFAIVWQKALLQYPDLAPEKPMHEGDADIFYAENKKKDDIVINKLSKEAGLFYFYSSECPYCARQTQYIKRFQAMYPQFVIKPVSIDGVISPELPDSLIDNGIAANLQVNTVPAIFLAFPPDRFERVATGIVTPDNLRRALVYYATEVQLREFDYAGMTAK